MKKIISAIIAAVIAFSSLVILSSCGAKPELDLDDAKKNLETKGYTVFHYEEDEDTAPGVREHIDAYKDGNRLSISKFSNEKLAKLYYKSLKASFDSRGEELKTELKYYKHLLKKETLASAEEDMVKEKIKSLESELDNYKDLAIGRDGKIVWEGTKTAIKASKGK